MSTARLGSNNTSKTDVCILGAGMAGLTLARQLLQTDSSLSITLVEHRQFPAPLGAHKVGESTVEIAAHYLAENLCLKTHLERDHLPKFGLRLFVRGDEAIHNDLAQYDEIGVSKVLPIQTYQLDRGRFENYLATELINQGVDLRQNTTVRKIDLRPGKHRVTIRNDDQEQTICARYLVDASGRRAWLREQMSLTRKVRHTNNAVWFRTDARFELESWSADQSWRNRVSDTPRHLSTNHFTGPGYWLWLIPLAGDCTSVGLVFDPNKVEVSDVNKHENLLRWLSHEHPLIAEKLADHEPRDFHVLKDYAVNSEQLFSADGWMLSGDSGAFTDPFYSPGADFIAFANGFITELITKQEGAEKYQQFQNYYLRFFANTLSLYRGQYGGFGDRNLMVLKTIWDFTYYWGTLSRLFFTSKYADSTFMDANQAVLTQGAALNTKMQRKFRTMAKNTERVGGQGRFFDHHALPLFHTMKQDLLTPNLDNTSLDLQHAVGKLGQLSELTNDILARLDGGQDMPALDELGREAVFSS